MLNFWSLLTLLFIGLKLTGYIGWSWWLVLGPLWIPTAVFIAFIFGIMLLGFLCAIVVSVLERPWK